MVGYIQVYIYIYIYVCIYLYISMYICIYIYGDMNDREHRLKNENLTEEIKLQLKNTKKI
jgi:hypothetical protein